MATLDATTSMKQPSLSIVLPVHNEVRSLEKVISEWDDFLHKIQNLRCLFIICEDGSTDGTKELIVRLKHQYPIVNNSLLRRRGYGQAVSDGIAIAETDYVLCIDSDGQISPEQIEHIWHRRSEDRFLVGWRRTRCDPQIRLVYSQMFKLYHWLLFPNRLHDPSCPFVLGHKNLFTKVAPFLSYMTEGFWWGFVGACCKLNIALEEVQIVHRQRFAGGTQVYRFGKMPGIALRNAVGLLKLRFASNARRQSGIE